MKNLKLTSLVIALTLMVGLFSCSDDESTTKGSARISATDAKVDAENVIGVFLSVKEIQAKGDADTKTVISFEDPLVFNLMAYQNGETFAMGEGDVEVGSYNELRFIISGESDSYLEMKDGSKKSLEIPSGTSSGYKIAGAFDIAANETVDLVADIDLRKALTVTGEGTYKLRPTGRVVEAEATGIIRGTISGDMPQDKQLIVFAYLKGTYSEEEASTTNPNRFDGAINSAFVSSAGSYTLAFMEEGEYELVVASYSNTDDDDELEFDGTLDFELLLGIDVINSVEIESNSTVELSIELL